MKISEMQPLISLSQDWDLADTIKYHKEQHGSCMPGTQAVICFADMIQSNIYRIFDALEHDNPEDRKDYINTMISSLKREEGQEYLIKYLTDVALMVLDIYKKEDFASIEKETPSPSIGKRIKNWFKGRLMP